MEVELTKKLAQNLEYNDDEFEVVMTATRTELLDLGEVDCVIVIFTITGERRKNWDFSTPY